jgi:Flp pilus assembly pilin Flp
MFLDLYVKAKTFFWGIREDGAVATEYGLLLVLIALAIIVAAGALGIILGHVFENASTGLANLPK